MTLRSITGIPQIPFKLNENNYIGSIRPYKSSLMKIIESRAWSHKFYIIYPQILTTVTAVRLKYQAE